MAIAQPVRRYHPVIVVLHWLIAALIVLMLLGGYFVIAPMPEDAPQKLDVLEIHMALGMAILGLMVIRLILRAVTARPPAEITGGPLDRVAVAVHGGFYLLVALMAVFGMWTAIGLHLNDIVFARNGAPLPPDLRHAPTVVAHGWAALVLALLIVLHVAGALYHRMVLRDEVMARMGFGARR
ncbi:MAG: cytochrome b [Limimaricola sp.]|uniref:cytochrome b n=1 Tax=Limimaricola sp. TaxID=2211665 RepID=UPI001D300721|nr:cytochrome b/b6 domain-containing protein [Limimaricola sp.]MBI1415992.1 cytochrome b [Limimaricola sp.]